METLSPSDHAMTLTVRFLVIGSWLIFLTVWVLWIPVPETALLSFVLAIFAAIFGIIALITAILHLTRWRLLSLLASLVYLATYFSRVAISSIDRANTWHFSLAGGVLDYYKDVGLITFHLINDRLGLISFLAVEVLMPLSQIAILWLLLRPNPRVESDALARLTRTR